MATRTRSRSRSICPTSTPGAWRGSPVSTGLILVFLAAMGVQALAWWSPSPAGSTPFAAVLTLAGSSALYGLLALWFVFARRLAGPENAGSQPERPALS